jgi:hypothetical protein
MPWCRQLDRAAFAFQRENESKLIGDNDLLNAARVLEPKLATKRVLPWAVQNEAILAAAESLPKSGEGGTEGTSF